MARAKKNSHARDQAREAGLVRYFGGVCDRHPEVRGERYTASYGCIVCARISARIAGRLRALTPEQRARHNVLQLARYHASPARREYMRNYARTDPKRKERDSAKRATPKWRAYIRAYKTEYGKRKAAELAAKNAAYRKANRARARETQRCWRERNRDHANALSCARRTQMPSWADRKAILAIYKAAGKLRSDTGLDYDVDHVIPLRGRTVSGLHVETNLQIIERRTNRAKTNRFLD